MPIAIYVDCRDYFRANSVPFRASELALPRNSECLGMSTFFRGITETVPSLFRGIFSERYSVPNPNYRRMTQFPCFRSPPRLSLTIEWVPETFLTFSRIDIFFLVDPVCKQYCTVIPRESREGKLLLTVKTEANWYSTSTNKRSSSLVGSLVRWALHASTRDFEILYTCLVCSSPPSTKIFFPRRTPFQFIKLSGQSCRVTWILICVSDTPPPPPHILIQRVTLAFAELWNICRPMIYFTYLFLQGQKKPSY